MLSSNDIIYYYIPGKENVLYVAYKENIEALKKLIPNAVIMTEEEKDHYLISKQNVSISDVLKYTTNKYASDTE